MKIFYSKFALLAILSFVSWNCGQNNSVAEKKSEQVDSLNKTNIKTEEITFKQYCSSRFGYCVDYPDKILFPQGESDNGDGQMFKSKTAENYLQVYRDYRDMIEEDSKFDLEDAYQLDTWSKDPKKPKRVITYKNLQKNYYVVSGYNNGKIYYQKTIISNELLITCMIEYNESEKLIYGKVCDRMFKSFK